MFRACRKPPEITAVYYIGTPRCVQEVIELIHDVEWYNQTSEHLEVKRPNQDDTICVYKDCYLLKVVYYGNGQKTTQFQSVTAKVFDTEYERVGYV